MTRKANIRYHRKYTCVVVVKFHGRELIRELEPKVEQCACCSKERSERYTDFYSYDDFELPDIVAFCNLNCYGRYLANGRMTQSRDTKLQRALELLEYLEREEEKATRPKPKKSPRKSRRHLSVVA